MRRILLSLLLGPALLRADAIEFAADGALKMLYDNRMYPQAVESAGRLYMVWRGDLGLPRIRAYDLEARRFSESHALLDGTGIDYDAERFERDQHYAPVIWVESDGLLHVAFGFHRTPGFHLVSSGPGRIDDWERLPGISHSVSYPQVHRISDRRTLVYFRDSGHLGSWTYRISSDGGRSWEAPELPVIDMDAPPHGFPESSHAGSYQTTRVSADGRTLHIAFIWKMENPEPSNRYGGVLHDYTRRHNLYYVRLDLASGKVFNALGNELPRPVNFATALSECLVWDTEGGSAAVGPSIALGESGEPYFLLPVSGTTPYASTMHFVHLSQGRWKRIPLATTGHPFNSTHLVRRADGSFRAYLIAGDGEASEAGEMNRYGWGDRVEEWESGAAGDSWTRIRNLAPFAGLRYQGIQFVRAEDGGLLEDLLLFYGWTGNGKGRAFLVDDRRRAPEVMRGRAPACPSGRCR